MMYYVMVARNLVAAQHTAGHTMAPHPIRTSPCHYMSYGPGPTVVTIILTLGESIRLAAMAVISGCLRRYLCLSIMKRTRLDRARSHGSRCRFGGAGIMCYYGVDRPSLLLGRESRNLRSHCSSLSLLSLRHLQGLLRR